MRTLYGLTKPQEVPFLKKNKMILRETALICCNEKCYVKTFDAGKIKNETNSSSLLGDLIHEKYHEMMRNSPFLHETIYPNNLITKKIRKSFSLKDSKELSAMKYMKQDVPS